MAHFSPLSEIESYLWLAFIEDLQVQYVPSLAYLVVSRGGWNFSHTLHTPFGRNQVTGGRTRCEAIQGCARQGPRWQEHQGELRVIVSRPPQNP